MGELVFVKGYCENQPLRQSFFELANTTFGLDFLSWYEQGFWNRNYIPYSYIHQNKVIANVSINLLNLVIEGLPYRAIQIGTVMTHPDYRHQGLSRKLMNKVLADYQDKYEFMYLFANDRVLEFYPKFGFQRVHEYHYSAKLSLTGNAQTKLKRLDIQKQEDLERIHRFAKSRLPVSNRFGTNDALHIFMYHCLNPFQDSLYYHPTQDALVLYEKRENQIDLYDIVRRKKGALIQLLNDLAEEEGSYQVVFHYTPEEEELKYDRVLKKDGGSLFVKTNGTILFPSGIKHPITSEA